MTNWTTGRKMKGRIRLFRITSTGEDSGVLTMFHPWDEKWPIFWRRCRYKRSKCASRNEAAMATADEGRKQAARKTVQTDVILHEHQGRICMTEVRMEPCDSFSRSLSRYAVNTVVYTTARRVHIREPIERGREQWFGPVHRPGNF
jgi:hypothetical protein